MTPTAVDAERHARYAWELGEAGSPDDHLARMAFAMVSANTGLDQAVAGWHDYLATNNWHDAQAAGCSNARWLPMLEGWANTWVLDHAAGIYRSYLERQLGESWTCYHRRIAMIPGLGIVKAAFAVALCHPTTCPIPCIDTWMARWLYGEGDKRWRRRGRYNKLREHDWERYYGGVAMIRAYADDWGVPGFVAQWTWWDHLRGSDNPHRFMVGQFTKEENT